MIVCTHARIVFDIFFVGIARWEFAYAIPYSLALLSIALVLVQDRADLIAALLSGLLAVMAVFTSTEVLPAPAAAIGSVIVFVVLSLNLMGVFNWKSDAGIKYVTLMGMFFILAWVVSYFYTRVANTALAPANLATILYHGGVGVVCLGGILRTVLSGPKYKNIAFVGLIGALLAVIGVVWLAGGYGWGLQLIN